MVKDIQKRLDFREENVFRMSFERKNLAYIVRRTENKAEELLHILTSVQGSAIVYTRNRKKTKEVSQYLNEQGITATFYHAGLNNDTKDQRQKGWINGEFRVMVATNAFGMGIDKPDVRLVVHIDFPDSPEAYFQEAGRAGRDGQKSRVMVATNAFGMGIDKPDVRLVVHIDFPDSPEAYFQEAGRAGRDGQKSYAVLLYARSDKTLLNKRIADTFPEKEYIRQVYEHINYYYQMAMGDGLGCTYAFNIDEFCQNFKHFPIRVDSALKILTRAGYLEYTDEQDNASRLMFTLRRDELYRIQENNPDTENLIRIILRSYTGLFSDYAYINEETLALRSGLSRQQVYETLVLLTKRHILHYIPGKKTPYIIYTRERQESERIVLNRDVYEDRKASYEQRIKAMLEYADAENKCRSRILLQYFGEKNEHNCGLCDACLAKHSSGLKHGEFEDIRNQIMDILQSPCSSHDLLEALPGDKEKKTKALSYLLAEEVIGQEHGKLYICK